LRTMKPRIEITEENIQVLRIVKGQNRKNPLTAREISAKLETPATGFIRTCEKKKFLDRVDSDKPIRYVISPLGRKAISAWDLLF